MKKRVKQLIIGCHECPYVHTVNINEGHYTSHYCGLGSMYVTPQVHKKEFHELCLLEDDLN